MLKMKSLGYRTGALDVTRGEMGTRGTVEGRAMEAENAAKILRLDIRENLGFAGRASIRYRYGAGRYGAAPFACSSPESC